MQFSHIIYTDLLYCARFDLHLQVGSKTDRENMRPFQSKTIFNSISSRESVTESYYVITTVTRKPTCVVFVLCL